MAEFAHRCEHRNALRNLQSITLTVHTQTSVPVWTKHVVGMLSASPLLRFHVSTVGGEYGQEISDEFCSKIVDSHGERLQRFSVHRMRIGLEAVEDICRRCVVLEELFVVVEQESLVRYFFVSEPFRL